MSGPIKVAGCDHDQLNKVSAGLSTYAGSRLVTLEDGMERGVRVMEMRSGGGLDFDVMIDRSGDIGRLACDGQTLSWHSAGGLRSPWLINQEGDLGQGFLRGFGGFLNTCGLDHIRQPEANESTKSNSQGLAQNNFPLHGMGTFQPAIIRGGGLVDDVAAPYVFCETEFVQVMSFVSALRLRRRIETPVGSRRITIRDEVRNIGNDPATHMLLYHHNLGFPLVAEGTSIDMGRDECVWLSEPHEPLEPVVAPENSAHNLISVFKHASDEARVRILSPQAKLALDFAYPSAQLPYCQVLRMPGSGTFGIGIEPCTTDGRTRQEAREKGEMIILQPGETRHYSLSIEITKFEEQVKE